MTLKRYKNVGTQPLRISKSYDLKPGEETKEFIALDPAKEKFWMDIGALEILEEKKKSAVDPETVLGPGVTVESTGGLPAVAADIDPRQPVGLTESEIKEREKETRKKK